jgi:hypothetical protein
MVCLRLRDNGRSSSEIAVCLKGLSCVGRFGLGVKYCEPGPVSWKQVSGPEVVVLRTCFPGPVRTKNVGLEMASMLSGNFCDMPYLEA